MRLLSTLRLLLLLGLVACRPDPESNRGVAERFLDAHYVRINLAEAQMLTAGFAEKKVGDERRLVGDQEIDEGTRKPTVGYRLVEERPDGEDRTRMLYRVTFMVPGADGLERKVLLLLRREPAGWKVVNFEEFE